MEGGGERWDGRGSLVLPRGINSGLQCIYSVCELFMRSIPFENIPFTLFRKAAIYKLRTRIIIRRIKIRMRINNDDDDDDDDDYRWSSNFKLSLKKVWS